MELISVISRQNKTPQVCGLRGHGAGMVPSAEIYTIASGVRLPTAPHYTKSAQVQAMNKLKLDKQEAVIQALVEGCSIRSAERMTGVHRDTIMRLLVQVGQTCDDILDPMMRGLTCKRIEVDEIWCYVGKKQRHITATDDPNVTGEFYTWVAIDADTKIVPVHRVSKRDAASAHAFITDLASRLENRIQLSSDALRFYVDAVEAGFGPDVDYATIVKSYEAEAVGPGRYSPPKVISVNKRRMVGRPDMKMASTAYVERNNLTMRMAMRRFTRLTNAFSKKVENLRAAVSLHFAWYNLVRGHRSLHGATPAMAAGIQDDFWSLRDLIELSN